jgi:3-hydroxybutyrate dehydrogenase
MLKGRTALITGSLDGIGFAIADALAAKGASIMLNGFGPVELVYERTQSLQRHGGEADYHGADISKLAEIEAMVAATRRRFGAIDILVNNAVTRHSAEIENFPVDKWDYALAVNLSAPFHLIRLTMAGMKSRRWGRIINLASTYGVLGTPRRADYCATKHGLVGLTRTVALEGIAHNITCNALCPGAVDTPNMRKVLAERSAATGKTMEETLEAFWIGHQPSRRLVAPEKVGKLAAFLCSDDAADMTGTPIAIDGAWLAGT